jgi:hormone-sensitive lipase
MSEEENGEMINAEEVSASIHNVMDALISLCESNAEVFRLDDSESGQRLSAAFYAMTDHISTLRPLIEQVRAVAPSYDFDSNTPGNGYRSFVTIVDSFIIHGMGLARKVEASKKNIFFRKTIFMKEVEACSHVLASLGVCLQHLTTLISWSEPGNLFPDEKHSPIELLSRAHNINQYCFYGRCLGFQYCDSMRKALQFICIAMASYSEAYYNTGGLFSKATNSVITGSKYLLDPELRARRIVNIAQYSDVEFCKSFWQLAETDVMQHLHTLVSASIAVNREISIPPEPIKMQGVNGKEVIVPTPSSHIGTAPIMVRLLSASQRRGMVGQPLDSAGSLPPSTGLLVHCHGGGFVAQSSRSHECYLRDWASRLGVPILSVDYSLAPAAPYPRALEEALYAYCWALQNCHLLGSKAERVILIGDSAGANLNLGVAMKCIELGLPPPHGLFLAYVPVLVSCIPSPARLLCLMDPLLPFGFMMRCLKAYAGHICTSVDSDDVSHTHNRSADELFVETASSDGRDSLMKSPSKVSDAGSDPLATVSLVSQSLSEPDEPNPATNITTDVMAGAGSRGYITQFLDRYVLHQEPATGSTGTAVDSGEQEMYEFPTLESSPTLTERLSTMASSIMGHFSGTSSRELSRENSQEAKEPSPTLPLDPSELDALLDVDPTEEFKFMVPKDPYLSPYWASDSVLSKLPPTKILSLQLDPCLDDCVMFARKLKGLNNDVHLDVLSGLPHGFLNFNLISKEAHEASMLCVERIKSLLENQTESSPITTL